MCVAQWETFTAVKRKLSITWDADETDARVRDCIEAVTPFLNSRLGYPADHEFSRADGEPWPLFLNACLYEFSNALDAFADSYAADVRAARAYVASLPKGGADAS